MAASLDKTEIINGLPAWLTGEIASVIAQREAKGPPTGYWGEPLAAVASADDPLFARLREVVDPEHAMPSDLLPSAQSVVVYFLPFRRWLGKENSLSGEFASRGWAEAYVATNRMIADVNARLKAKLREEGFDAVETPATHNFDEVKLVSRWSHKHLGYIAGLGTFGVHHLLITRAGCCGRLGSLVTDMPIPATPRPEEEWCLAKAGFTCSACVKKCVYGALRTGGFDRTACYAQCLRTDAYYSDLPLVDVCGKCGCEAPCSHGIPPRKAAGRGAGE